MRSWAHALTRRHELVTPVQMMNEQPDSGLSMPEVRQPGIAVLPCRVFFLAIAQMYDTFAYHLP